MRIDLHCHSRFSQRPTLWIMQKLGCPESLTVPQNLYNLALARGMNAVTITDHNMIEGVLDITHLPNTFISCEYTSYFPEDRCKVHVLAYDITEKQHEVLLAARENIFEFVSYMNQEGIAHACAHPLFGPNDRLKAEHIEKLFLLFKVWEWNGDLAPEINHIMKRLVGELTEAEISRLIEKHELQAYGPEPWRKCLIAGSDDHSSLNLASTCTEVREARDFPTFWDGVLKMQARVQARPNTPQALARSIYSIGYQFYKEKFTLEKYLKHDVFLSFMDRILQSQHSEAHVRPGRIQRYFARRRVSKQSVEKMTLFELARHEAAKMIDESPDFLGILENGLPHGIDLDQLWESFVNTLANKLLVHLGEHLAERIANARLFDLFHSLGSAAALYTVLAPFFVSYSHFVQQRNQANALYYDLKRKEKDYAKRETKVAHFTDTFFEMNGVARTLQQQLATARSLGKAYCVITCDTKNREYMENLHVFSPVGSWGLPEYPEIKLFVPPFLQLLHYCYMEGFTHIHVSTPGPIGLAALGIARILQLPISGTYHTSMPQYGRILTEDSYVEDLLWKGMLAFYDQLDAVYSPSRATAQELVDRGFDPDKINVYPRGVNVERFHPDKKDSDMLLRLTGGYDATTLLYVGRISKEKGLDLLGEAFRALVDKSLEVQLIVVGDGPYRTEMEARLQGYPAYFTGVLDGDALPAIYAASDIFVFPSATDTFGNVVLEAQASGIPVIVCDEGGPHENILPEATGLVFKAGCVTELTAAMTDMVVDPAKRKQFGVSARKYIEKRSFQNAFATLYEMYISESEKKERPQIDSDRIFGLGKTFVSGAA